MPRFYVKNPKGEWNIFSTITDDYVLDEFKPFVIMKNWVLQQELIKRNDELDSLLTDNPELNTVSFEEVEKTIAERKESEEYGR